MKKSLGLLIIAFMVMFNTSCKKEEVNELTEFDINYTANLSVPSNTIPVNAQPIDFTTPNIPTNSTQKFTENKTIQSLVDQILLTKYNVSVGTGNLDFLKSLSIYIKADGMSETLVATKTNIPTGLTTLAMDLQDVNIRDYIFKPNIQFRVAVVIDASTLSGQTLIMDQTVHVKATVLK